MGGPWIRVGQFTVDQNGKKSRDASGCRRVQEVQEGAGRCRRVQVGAGG